MNASLRSFSILLLFFEAAIGTFGRVDRSFADREVPPFGSEAVARVIPDSVRFDQKIADGSRVHMTVTNYGFYGNNFLNRSASLEFPGGAGYEHMTGAGLWIGAQAQDGVGAFTGVTTGAVDAGQGPTSPDRSEWTPGDRGIRRRSRLFGNIDYDPRAVSDLDMICDYNDLSPTRAAGNPEDHRSMGLEVHQETYQWSLPEVKDALFLHSRITNRGAPLTNVWVGLWSELASGNKNAYVFWPPSSGDPGGQGGWFNNKWLVYDAPRRLLREHYCDAQPIPTGCRLERAPYWIGVQLLNRPDTTAGQRITLAAWPWSAGSPYRDQDVERYAILSAGTLQPLDGDSLLPGTGDPVELLAIGPYPRLETGDSISVDFAFVGGAEVDSIGNAAAAAQAAFDRGYRDILVPVTMSWARAVQLDDHVRVEWYSATRSPRATVERRLGTTDWSSVGQVDADVSGRMVFEDHDAAPGARRGYRLLARDGSALPGSEVWVAADAPALMLHPPRPHPAGPEGLRLSFALPRPEPARLEIFDLAGRRVWERHWSAPVIGDQSIVATGLPEGVFLARLTQGARSVSIRAVVLK
jgi:hypothetical protein